MQIERRRVDASAIAAIPFEGAKRPLDRRTVKEMAAELALLLARGSAPDSGFNNPIELAELREEEQPDPGKLYRILAGFHRYEAWLHAKGMRERGDPDYSHLVCTVYIDTTPGQQRFIHLRENLRRKDLSEPERRAWAAEFGELTGTAKVSTNGTNLRKGRGAGGGRKADPWFTTWMSDTKTPKQTAVNWWNDYKAAHGLEKPPGKASREEQAAFFAWTRAKALSDAAAAEQAAEDARAQERSRAAARRGEALEASLRADFVEYLSIVGSAAAAALAMRLHDIASGSPCASRAAPPAAPCHRR